MVFVDDPSEDRTSETADQPGAGDGRPKVIHLRDLPAGWLEKNCTCRRGAREARRKLLLFADGDVVFGGEAVAPGVRRQLSVTRPERRANRDRISTTALARSARRA